MINGMQRSVRSIAQSLNSLFSRGVVSAVNPDTKMQTVQIQLLDGEAKDAVEHFEPYGLTAHPHPGAEQVTAFLDGDRSHGVVLIVADRRYRLAGLAPGEVALYDDQGQRVHLTRNGIVIHGADKQITITGAPKLRVESSMLECTGDIKDNCDSSGKTMAGMRSTYNNHTHPETGSTTNKPNQSMS